MANASAAARPILFTPDRRYLVVRGRLWRATNPGLKPAERDALTNVLMEGRRSVRRSQQVADPSALRAARRRIDAAKVLLGERGPVWWQDGAPDWNRHLVRNTPYRAWFEALRLSPAS